MGSLLADDRSQGAIRFQQLARFYMTHYSPLSHLLGESLGGIPEGPGRFLFRPEEDPDQGLAAVHEPADPDDLSRLLCHETQGTRPDPCEGPVRRTDNISVFEWANNHEGLR